MFKNNSKTTEKKCGIIVVPILSICCKKGTTITNTTNDIKCYKCNDCGKLTGIEDEFGKRLN